VFDLGLPLAALLPETHVPYVALMLIGFGVGIFGSMLKQRWLMATGIILIVLGALLLPLAAGLPGSDEPPGAGDFPQLESGE
jgi:biotin transporter BioY